MLGHDRFYALARAEPFENRFYGNARAGDDRLTHHDVRIRVDALHEESLGKVKADCDRSRGAYCSELINKLEPQGAVLLISQPEG